MSFDIAPALEPAFFVHTGRAASAAFLFQEVTMEWIGWAIVIALIGGISAYRYAFGKWPLRFDL